MALTLDNLADALHRFPAYRAIDVFADDLVELRALPPHVQRLDDEGKRYAVHLASGEYQLDIFPKQGVVRLSQKTSGATMTGAVAGAMAGATLGTAIASANDQKGVGLGGAILGLLVGASLGAAGEARRVFALTYDRTVQGWRAYDGGLLRWMKDRLAVPV